MTKNNVIVSMCQHSDFLIMLLVVSLLFLSIFTWSFFFSRFLFLMRSKRFLRHDLSILKNTSTIEEVVLLSITPKCFLSFPVILLLKDIVSELYLSRYINICSPCCINVKSSVKERVMICLERRLVHFKNFMERGNMFFSTVASVSPFIGLFGTIWCITKYFFNFPHAQYENFSIISSGISEALVLTGFGLFVAIPALIMYNVFVYDIITCENIIDECAVYLILLLMRDLESGITISCYTLLNAYQKRF